VQTFWPVGRTTIVRSWKRGNDDSDAVIVATGGGVCVASAAGSAKCVYGGIGVMTSMEVITFDATGRIAAATIAWAIEAW